jgi:glycosyltransferase involved in cell wall biosynthesis
MKVFLGTTATNHHVHQIGLALYEANSLSRYMVPYADLPLAWPWSLGRKLVAKFAPRLDGIVQRRRPPGIPAALIKQRPAAELFRLAVAKAGLPETWADSIWAREEHAFSRGCGRVISREHPDIFLGVEHGALEALRVARQEGVLAGVIFTSLHHRFRERWLAPELEKFPELLDRTARTIRLRDSDREARRDEELRQADFVHANSVTTARALEEVGVPPDRIITVPLGAPPVLQENELRLGPPSVPVVIFVGNVAPHKGAHHLIDAWSRLTRPYGARLEFYGRQMLPAACLPPAGTGVIFHGPTPHHEVREAMRQASVLVLPSLADGFGMVVMEAMSQGLPVICSSNVGASQMVREGENGFIIPPADPARLAERIAWCLDHPQELHAMGRNAVATAAGWTWGDFRREFVRKLIEMSGRLRTARP